MRPRIVYVYQVDMRGFLVNAPQIRCFCFAARFARRPIERCIPPREQLNFMPGLSQQSQKQHYLVLAAAHRGAGINV
jgi:hypothetical protein